MRQLRMHRPDLNAEPAVYPPGYRFRRARWDDRAGLIAVLDPSFDDFGWNEDKLKAECLEHPRGLGCYLVEGPDRIAAAVTGLVSIEDPTEGYVHFLGVHPDERGHRLGQLILVDLFGVFRENGMSSTILDTDDWRVPAIKSYVNLGYVPRIVEDGQVERWETALSFLDADVRERVLANLK